MDTVLYLYQVLEAVLYQKDQPGYIAYHHHILHGDAGNLATCVVLVPQIPQMTALVKNRSTVWCTLLFTPIQSFFSSKVHVLWHKEQSVDRRH